MAGPIGPSLTVVRASPRCGSTTSPAKWQVPWTSIVCATTKTEETTQPQPAPAAPASSAASELMDKLRQVTHDEQMLSASACQLEMLLGSPVFKTMEGVGCYWSTSDEVVLNTQNLLGAGILPFTQTPDGGIYFLLGQEHYVSGWRGSHTWSAFEGGRKGDDPTMWHTAAREYMEESLGVLEGHCNNSATERVVESLQNHQYALRVSLMMPTKKDSGRQRRRPSDSNSTVKHHLTFVRHFAWSDDLDSKFTNLRELLLQQASNSEPCGDFLGHFSEPTNTVEENLRMFHKHQTCADYMEKKQVQLWSAADLRDVVLHKHPMYTAFRPCFLHTLAVVLQEFESRTDGKLYLC